MVVGDRHHLGLGCEQELKSRVHNYGQGGDLEGESDQDDHRVGCGIGSMWGNSYREEPGYGSDEKPQSSKVGQAVVFVSQKIDIFKNFSTSRFEDFFKNN